MLRALAADNAFVWGLVDSSPKDSSSAKAAAVAGHSFHPFLSAASLSASVTDHSLRAAQNHLRQFAPPDRASEKALGSYIAAVGRVFESAPVGSVPETMVAGAADQLTALYTSAVRRIKDALLEKSAPVSLVFCLRNISYSQFSILVMVGEICFVDVPASSCCLLP